MDTFFRDLKQSLRMFRQSPSFTITALAEHVMSRNELHITALDGLKFTDLGASDFDQRPRRKK